jgi:hypothetical protein
LASDLFVETAINLLLPGPRVAVALIASKRIASYLVMHATMDPFAFAPTCFPVLAPCRAVESLDDRHGRHRLRKRRLWHRLVGDGDVSGRLAPVDEVVATITELHALIVALTRALWVETQITAVVVTRSQPVRTSNVLRGATEFLLGGRPRCHPVAAVLVALETVGAVGK